MTSDYQYLLPQPDPETQPFWDAAREHRLEIQRCADCRVFRWPPQLTCANCQGEDHEWVELSGRGTLYTYIIVHQPVLAQWRDSGPYNIIQVALEEAPEIRMTSNAVEVDNSQLKVEMPLEVVFDDVTAEDTIPRWRPRR
jgi:uncharacterized OB-fold protein